MLTKPKYDGFCIEDLLEIYQVFIRSKAEFMLVLWHSSLNSDEEKKVENIQKVCLKVILQEIYINYEAVLEMTSLQKLSVCLLQSAVCQTKRLLVCFP